MAVIAMVLTHAIDSWTRDADRRAEPFYTLLFIGGVASALFLFLAGLATAMSAHAKGRRQGSHRAGAAMARRRGWEIFALALVFRLQSQLLGMGPIVNLFKVDMLNIMGLSIVAVSYVWEGLPRRRQRVLGLALLSAAVTLLTPLVRSAGWLGGLPDPVEAYLRPAGGFAAFPFFPWGGFLFAGALVGDLVDGARASWSRQARLQIATVIVAGAGVWLAWQASFLPALYPNARFWSDSPTFFFIRLGLVALLLPAAWTVEQLITAKALQPLVTLGRASLFVYWIHVEMIFGVVAEPLKRQLPIWNVLAAAMTLSLLLYALVILKNHLLERYELRGPWRLLAPVIR